MTEYEMVGWHHRHNGHEFEQAQGAGDGQGSLACCSPWGRRELDTTEQLNNKKCDRSSSIPTGHTLGWKTSNCQNTHMVTNCPDAPGTEGFLGRRTCVIKIRKSQTNQYGLVTLSVSSPTGPTR